MRLGPEIKNVRYGSAEFTVPNRYILLEVPCRYGSIIICGPGVFIFNYTTGFYIRQGKPYLAARLVDVVVKYLLFIEFGNHNFTINQIDGLCLYPGYIFQTVTAIIRYADISLLC